MAGLVYLKISKVETCTCWFFLQKEREKMSRHMFSSCKLRSPTAAKATICPILHRGLPTALGNHWSHVLSPHPKPSSQASSRLINCPFSRASCFDQSPSSSAALFKGISLVCTQVLVERNETHPKTKGKKSWSDAKIYLHFRSCQDEKWSHEFGL